ncbi:MAG TPA: hypothetical protein DDW33_04990 [Ktedonobacter sp.]|nr:hypothetical protein [Ktedonobacter sp.]HBE25027.1 hypothetical protein [Ktedonobacter sp.]
MAAARRCQCYPLVGTYIRPVLMARPAWWKVTIWIDAVFFGPFYIVAIYAYMRGKE